MSANIKKEYFYRAEQFEGTDVRFDGYFGFTDSEVKDMLEYYGFTAVDESRQWSEMLELLILPEQCRMKQT